MKKTLVTLLALIFVLGIAGTALAAPANPFVDVPAKHWAYDAVNTLAKAGIVDGYGDGTFRGDRTMTRYEMAQIVAKAMARSDKADAANKALIDKLAVEFASELNNLGVRIAKVEAKQNVWVGGETRFRMYENSPGQAGLNKWKGTDMYDWRQRIKFWGTVNDDVSFYGRFATGSNEKFGIGNASGASATGAAGTQYLTFLPDQFYVSVKNFLGLDKVRFGRTPFDVFSQGLFTKPSGWDGVTIYNKFGAVDFTGYTGVTKFDGDVETASGAYNSSGTSGGAVGHNDQAITTAQLGFKLADSWYQKVGYFWNEGQGGATTLNANAGTSYLKSKGWDVSSNIKFNDLTLYVDYASTNLTGNVNMPSGPKAWSFQLTNGKKVAVYMHVAPFVDMNKVGDQAWAISYRSVDPGGLPPGTGGWDSAYEGAIAANNSYNLSYRGTDNLKGLQFCYQFTLAKGSVLSLDYQDWKVKNNTVLTTGVGGALDKFYGLRMEFFY